MKNSCKLVAQTAFWIKLKEENNSASWNKVLTRVSWGHSEMNAVTKAGLQRHQQNDRLLGNHRWQDSPGTKELRTITEVHLPMENWWHDFLRWKFSPIRGQVTSYLVAAVNYWLGRKLSDNAFPCKAISIAGKWKHLKQLSVARTKALKAARVHICQVNHTGDSVNHLTLNNILTQQRGTGNMDNNKWEHSNLKLHSMLLTTGSIPAEATREISKCWSRRTLHQAWWAKRT